MNTITGMPNPHGNDQHSPGFVEDTGDSATGMFNFGALKIDCDNVNAYLRSTAAKSMYLGGNDTYQLVLNSVGGGADRVGINSARVLFPVQAPTVSAPTYAEGGQYYDTTLHKLMIGGAAGWETVTSE